MAWTSYLLVGIIVMAGSAFKCKHTAFSIDQDPRYHPDFGYQVQVQESAVRPSDHSSARLRIETPPRRVEDASKVLSWKPYAESRLGQNSDKIVFPGPAAEKLPLKISEECKKIGICEQVPDYPNEEVNKLVEMATRKGLMFQTDKLDLPEIPDIAQRVGAQEENIELCDLREKVIFPQGGSDKEDNWYLLVNSNDTPVQGIKVEICMAKESNCSGIILDYQAGYTARCKQKYVYRTMAVIEKGVIQEKSIKVPSCCACVAKQN